MPKQTGDGYRLQIKDGATTFVDLGEEISVSINFTTDEADATTKDSDNWHEGLLTIRNVSLEASGDVDQDNTVYQQLEDAYFNRTQFLTADDTQIKIIGPNREYEGDASMLDFTPADAPHDGMVSFTLSMTGTGEWTLTRT